MRIVIFSRPPHLFRNSLLTIPRSLLGFLLQWLCGHVSGSAGPQPRPPPMDPATAAAHDVRASLVSQTAPGAHSGQAIIAWWKKSIQQDCKYVQMTLAARVGSCFLFLLGMGPLSGHSARAVRYRQRCVKSMTALSCSYIRTHGSLGSLDTRLL